jgi:hypothetical protein
MKHICVFCGSNLGAQPEYVEAARRVGQVLAQRQITLVYGGARVGTMGEIADSSRSRSHWCQPVPERRPVNRIVVRKETPDTWRRFLFD